MKDVFIALIMMILWFAIYMYSEHRRYKQLDKRIDILWDDVVELLDKVEDLEKVVNDD